MMTETRLRVLVVAVTVLGLLAPSVRAPRSSRAAPPKFPECEHPWPCGDEWPEDLAGPFELGSIDPVTIENEGVTLGGWIALPAVPDKVNVPVILFSSPYYSWDGAGCTHPGHEAWYGLGPGAEDCPGGAFFSHLGIRLISLIEQGYAIAHFSVRGTGVSGGCVDFFGTREQSDQVAIIDWLAGQPWSNGRVGMAGLSYLSGTAFAAAVEAPDALKTIVTAGPLTDLYTSLHTPQGAAITTSPTLFGPKFTARASGPEDAADRWAPFLLERACGSTPDTLQVEQRALASDRRDAEFFNERRLIDGFPDVTAAVLLAGGFRDAKSHHFQDAYAWQTLTNAPKRAIQGYWAHEFPRQEGLDPENQVVFDPTWPETTWRETVIAWFDFWLKGIGEPARLGQFDYEVATDVPWISETAVRPAIEASWYSDSAWPPTNADDEVLYLAGETLTPTTGTGDRTFRVVTSPMTDFWGTEVEGLPSNLSPAFCGNALSDAAGLAYLSETLTEDIVLAGNPYVHLQLSSDLPGGVVGVHLLSVPDNFSCDTFGNHGDVHLLSLGAADLRFHQGNFDAAPFPVNDPTEVRIDLWDFAEKVPAGRRLAVLVSDGEIYASGRPYEPEITVHAGHDLRASQIVLPLVDGTLGGDAPEIAYPPRPFVPEIEQADSHPPCPGQGHGSPPHCG